MTDAEFQAILRRAVIMIVRAMMKRWGLTWRDFQPRDEADGMVVPLAPSG